MKRHFLPLMLALALTACNGEDRAEPVIIPLYDGPAPLSENWTHTECADTSRDGLIRYFNVTDPTLELFRPEHPNGAAMVILPGGSFTTLSYNLEGTDLARRLCGEGITSFVLKYRTTPMIGADGRPAACIGEVNRILEAKLDSIKALAGTRTSDRAPLIEGAAYAYADAERAMQYLRANADKYGIEHIGMVGFSAGSIATLHQAQYHDDASRPDFVGVVYGGWNESFVVPADPMPMFLCSPTRDLFGPDETMGVFKAWRDAHGAVEHHFYNKASHGYGAWERGKSSDGWVDAMVAFMKDCGFLYDRTPRELDNAVLEKTVSDSQEARIEAGKLLGSHVMVYQHGREVLNKCFGQADTSGKAMRGDEVYRIASMTKPVTAFALLLEHSRGHLSIYDDLSDYLPEFAEMRIAETGEKAVNSIKLYQLVAHTSGVGGVSIPKEEREGYDLQRAVEYLAGQPLDFEPGTRQKYSTGAFDLAARVIEITSGMKYDEYLQRNIFSKLGMVDTGFSPDSDKWSRMVGMHDRDEYGNSICKKMNDGCVFGSMPTSYPAAGAGLASTASDYMKFALMLSRNAQGFMDEETFKLFYTPCVSRSVMPGTMKWGLGVRVMTDGCGNIPEGSFGWSGAYGTHFWVDPRNEIVVVYMKNSVYDGGAGARTASELERDVMASLR